MATIENTYLNSIWSAGADAHKNLYTVTLSGGELTENNTTALKVRCSGFTPPDISQNSYHVKYITADIERPAAKINHSRSFSLTFRVDANYSVYKALLKQQQLLFDPVKHFSKANLKDVEDKLFTVTVAVLSDDNPKDTVKLFKFSRCWISNLDTISYSSSNSSPASVTATINYIGMEDYYDKNNEFSGVGGSTGDSKDSEKPSSKENSQAPSV